MLFIDELNHTRRFFHKQMADAAAKRADAHIAHAESLLARLRAADRRREVAILQHSTLTWLDTYAAASQVYDSEVLHDNYLRIARGYAVREMDAIDAMHEALCQMAQAV